MRSARRRGAERQRGFTLLIVFLLIILLVGVASVTLTSSQVDLRIAGEDVVAANTFYAAETAAAFGADWLRAQSPTTGGSAWQAILGSGDVHVCTGPVGSPQPWIAPTMAHVPFDPIRGTAFAFCVHNNALDPSFSTGSPSPNLTDSDGIITIEGYGFGPAGQQTRVSVELAVASVATVASDYVQSGGYALKQARGDNRSISTSASTGY
jgi:type II secretory pathway pseudopilin PulG